MDFLQTIIGLEIGFREFAICFFTSLGAGVLMSLAYFLFKRNENYHKDVPIALAILPALMCGVCFLTAYIAEVTQSAYTHFEYSRYAVALLAAIAVLRFRSEPRSFEEIIYLLFAIVIGFILGVGYIYVGLVVFGVVMAVLVLFNVIKFPFVNKKLMSLKITIPEELNHEEVFEDLLSRYCSRHTLVSIKSRDMGTMFLVEYSVVLKSDKKQKEFVDEIRSKNGNLNVVLISGIYERN